MTKDIRKKQVADLIQKYLSSPDIFERWLSSKDLNYVLYLEKEKGVIISFLNCFADSYLNRSRLEEIKGGRLYAAGTSFKLPEWVIRFLKIYDSHPGEKVLTVAWSLKILELVKFESYYV